MGGSAYLQRLPQNEQWDDLPDRVIFGEPVLEIMHASSPGATSIAPPTMSVRHFGCKVRRREKRVFTEFKMNMIRFGELTVGSFWDLVQIELPLDVTAQPAERLQGCTRPDRIPTRFGIRLICNAAQGALSSFLAEVVRTLRNRHAS